MATVGRPRIGTRFEFKLPDETRAALEEIAASQKRDLTSVVREAVVAYARERSVMSGAR